MIIIKNLTFYLQSEIFAWTSPFLFGMTALLTRRAAELSVVPISAASKLSVISIGFCVFFTRIRARPSMTLAGS